MSAIAERLLVAVCLMGAALQPASAAAIPEHISRPTFLVDQAWQSYRRLPANWRSCAKICEPIDYRAADHENTAFAYNEARLRPGLSSATRAELGRQATLFFGLRNETVRAFNACIRATHVPPRSKTRAEPIPAQCEAFNAQTLWERWCKSFDDFANSTLLPIFRKAYDTSTGNHLVPNQQLSIQVLTRVYASGRSVPGAWNSSAGVPKTIAAQIRSKINSFKFAPYPPQIANPPSWQDVDFRWSGTYTGQSGSPFVSYSSAKFKMNCEDFYKYNKLKD